MNGTREFLKDKTRPLDDIVSSIESMEVILQCADSDESLINENLAAHIYKPGGKFKGLSFKAKKKENAPVDITAGSTPEDDTDSLVQLDLPPEVLEEGEESSIVFCMIDAVEQFKTQNVSGGRIYGVSICNKSISGLNQQLNITISLPNADITENKEPSCRFLDYTSSDFKTDGCSTQWNKTEEKVICSCNHLTYFAILMVSPDISGADAVNLSYISLIGSSISLTFLLLTVLMLIIHRQASSDVSMKIHINLASALILLNVHFLPSSWAASLAPSGGCVYVAVMLHYSLLATFSWTAIEGFHLYLLLVRVFNTYVRRYLLKLGLLGWGVPAVVVSLVLIIDKSVYGLVTVITPGNNTDTTLQMCYISSDVVKLVTTAGGFALVFVCNLGVLASTVRLMLQLRASGAPSGERRRRGAVCRDACSVMAICCMLGVTWGLVLLSFNQLTLPGIYLFCILNSLQGFFISIWFCVSRLYPHSKNENSTETHSSRG
ncbi:adhesion G-protein coupled receptor G5-like isoform X2 [Sardina pilchardus]|uniref:adhesion G-protein coupled receptor G5-like isoform X2 n=1 Tax=Sardina pilchardus TaxID=27697 RepID=UPI002E0D8903